jgi:hypothetical protein
MPEVLTLDVGCPKCGGKANIQFADWEQEGAEVETSYRCPYCGYEHRFRAAGRAVWATPFRRPADNRH